MFLQHDLFTRRPFYTATFLPGDHLTHDLLGATFCATTFLAATFSPDTIFPILCNHVVIHKYALLFAKITCIFFHHGTLVSVMLKSVMTTCLFVVPTPHGMGFLLPPPRIQGTCGF